MKRLAGCVWMEVEIQFDNRAFSEVMLEEEEEAAAILLPNNKNGGSVSLSCLLMHLVVMNKEIYEHNN